LILVRTQITIISVEIFVKCLLERGKGALAGDFKKALKPVISEPHAV
jgi:hypothetical protein